MICDGIESNCPQIGAEQVANINGEVHKDDYKGEENGEQVALVEFGKEVSNLKPAIEVIEVDAGIKVFNIEMLRNGGGMLRFAVVNQIPTLVFFVIRG